MSAADNTNPLLESGDVDVAVDEEEEELLNRLSRGSIGSRLSGARLSTTEFENAPHKLAHEINPEEARKWLDPYHPCNRGIFASYLAVGFGLYFIQTPIAFYMVDSLSATPAQQSVVTGLMALPWAMKIGCGFLSDSTPIMGLRRKPYFIIGWTIFAICNGILALIGTPDIGILAVLIFLQTLGFVLADVCTDAMIVERSKGYESTENQGTLQATGYIIRFGGGVVGALAGAVLYNKGDWGWGVPIWGIFIINGALPAGIISPCIGSMVEIGLEKPPALRAQVLSIWQLVQQKAVWMPCTFIYIYNVLLVQNPAWNSFLVAGLGFSNFDIGLLTLAGALLSYVALIIYKRYLFDTSWRKIYIGTTLILLTFSCLQLVLVLKSNEIQPIGVQLLFAMGSYGVVMFAQSIQFLPACRMFLGMCPEGAEGASYAMLTTLSNLAGTVSYSMAAAMAGIWDVSIPTLEAQNYNGMWRLTLLCACVQLGGLFFLPLMPSGVVEQLAILRSSVESPAAGACFLLVVGASLSYVIVNSIIVIVDPGAESDDA